MAIVARLRSLGFPFSVASGGGGRSIESSRRLTAEQKFYGALVNSVADDLALPPTCVKHQLALSWTLGRCGCGCELEASGPSLDECASALNTEPDALRAMLLQDREPHG